MQTVHPICCSPSSLPASTEHAIADTPSGDALRPLPQAHPQSFVGFGKARLSRSITNHRPH
jgi:hypothetical protein